jgi:hypothetical protein
MPVLTNSIPEIKPYMKRLSIIVMILNALFSEAQQDSTTIPIPMKNGLIFYEKNYSLDFRSRKEQQSVKALQWFGKTFRENQNALGMADIKSGKIAGTGMFKVPVGLAGNYYMIRMKIVISVSDSGYLFQAFNYYEKPVEKGVSNEYSKIEYRWRDFRKGRPWSTEDQQLFEGMQEKSLSIMSSLEMVMSK